MTGASRVRRRWWLLAHPGQSLHQTRGDSVRVWVHHYNHHRPRTACGNQPPASRLHATADNVMTNYS